LSIALTENQDIFCIISVVRANFQGVNTNLITDDIDCTIGCLPKKQIGAVLTAPIYLMFNVGFVSYLIGVKTGSDSGITGATTGAGLPQISKR